MSYVGVDGCHYGWLAIRLFEDGSWELNKFENISSLWDKHKDAKLILIDIPIGLKDSGSEERLCDKEARKLLGKRRSSVFPVPCRPAVYASIDEASNINHIKTGRCLSEQTKGIICKIRQVDKLLLSDENVKHRIKEIHPEVCFTAFNGRKPMEYSKTKEKEKAFEERREVLRCIYPYTDKLIEEAKSKFLRKDVARDDIVDALAAAITASKKEQGLKSIPEAPEVDARGLPMQIVYYPA